MHDLDIDGANNLASAVQIAQLALKHRQNKNQRQRVVIFIGSPVAETKVGHLTQRWICRVLLGSLQGAGCIPSARPLHTVWCCEVAQLLVNLVSLELACNWHNSHTQPLAGPRVGNRLS